VVLLEAVPSAGAAVVDNRTVRAVVEAMRYDDCVGLYFPDRVGVQVRVTAVDAGRAVVTTLERWLVAVGRLAPEGWDVVRVQTWTSDEFTRECEG
jgi:hypothetical protein